MSVLRVDIAEHASSFRPGEDLSGSVSWRLDQPVEQLELRLFWYTKGKGDRDVQIVDSRAWANPALQERRDFRFTLPRAPYSFSGKLISLIWALELVEPRTGEEARVEFVMAPTGREILLHAGEG